MIAQLAVIFSFLGMGEFIVWATGVPIPSSILGMLLLTVSLKAGVVRLDQVEGVSNFLAGNLGFFFVPAAVGLLNCLGIIRQQWLPIMMAFFVSSLVVIGCTGLVHQYLYTRKLNKGSRDGISA